MNRAEYIRRITESIRRYVKINTGFGLIPVPVGHNHMLVFHMNNTQTGYILLNAQTKLLEGRIDYEDVKQIAEEIASIYQDGLCMRKIMIKMQASVTSIVIIICFSLFLTMLLLLSLADGTFFGQALGIFVVIIFTIVIWTSLA